MYDLPSEDPEEPGLPDEFHYYQPQLLRETFQPSGYLPDHYLVATDLNLYYDIRHPTWHKRPDWFAVLGVPSLYEERDLRMSYVIWQEQVAPYLVVELLSPGTEDEDLGRARRQSRQPPSKWTVYERILQTPYYVVFSRYTDTVQYFALTHGRYRALQLPEPRLWLPEAGLGLGLWMGTYYGLTRPWLRCYDAQGAWIPTAAERAEQAERSARQAERRVGQAEQSTRQAEQRATQAEQRAARLAAQLRALGIEPES
jgi:Uma2 family endonuclease